MNTTMDCCRQIVMMKPIAKTTKIRFMKKIFLIINTIFFFVAVASAQDDVYPTAAQKGTFYITNANIHVGNGTVINNGTIKITDGKIVEVGTNVSASGDVIDAKGKQVYPGLILPETDLGLKEI